MEIKKHGTTKQKNGERFVCGNCGCEFTVKEDEYYIGSYATFMYGATNTEERICSCPECHKICKKTFVKANPCITLTGTETPNA